MPVVKGPPIVATSGGRFKCPYCLFEADTKWGVKIHCSRAHKGQPQPYARPGERPREDEIEKNPVPATPAKPKRVRVRNRAKPQPVDSLPVEPVVTSVTLNYCPHCGTDLAIILNALAVAARVKEHIRNG